MKNVYIYTLKDPTTNLIRYVGKANDVKRRYKAHLNMSRKHNSRKKNWILKLRKIGLKPFVEIIDEVPVGEWQFWETYWISQCKTWGFDLINYTHGGDGATFGNKTSFKKGDGARPVVGINENLEVKYVFNSCTEASIYFGLNRTSISNVAKGVKKKSAGLAWVYKDDYDKMDEKSLYKEIKRRYTHKQVINSGCFKKGSPSPASIKTTLLDMETGFFHEFENRKLALEYTGLKGWLGFYYSKNNKLIKKRYKILT